MPAMQAIVTHLSTRAWRPRNVPPTAYMLVESSSVFTILPFDAFLGSLTR